MLKKRIAVFVSGGGSNMQALLDSINKQEINGEIVVVISSRSDAYALERAKVAGIPAVILPKGAQGEKESIILETLSQYRVDLCILAGYLSVITPGIIRQYENRIINIHPSLIPSFCGKGFYGHYVHEAVLEFGAKVSGCTVHFVAEGIDTGAIILQKAVCVQQEDTPETLAARILEQEHILLPMAVQLFCSDKLSIVGRRVIIKTKEEQSL